MFPISPCYLRSFRSHSLKKTIQNVPLHTLIGSPGKLGLPYQTRLADTDIGKKMVHIVHSYYV